MKIGPDGSLGRITSSAKNLINNVRIIKAPDYQSIYKLAVIQPKDEQEDLSEKSEELSDEEMSDNELLEIKLPLIDIGKEKVFDRKTEKSFSCKHVMIRPNNKCEKISEKSDKKKAVNELLDAKFPSEGLGKDKIIDKKTAKPGKSSGTVTEGEYNYHKRHRLHHKRNNGYFGQRNNFNKIFKRVKSLSNMEEIYNYGNQEFNKDFNSSKILDFNNASCQYFSNAPKHDLTFVTNPHFPLATSQNFASATIENFSSIANHHAIYNADNYQHSSKRLLESPVLLPNYSHSSFPLAVPVKSKKSVGLLGDYPSYVSSLSKFQPNNFIYDQNSTYIPMLNSQSNTKSDNFAYYQTSPYSPTASNFALNHPSNKKSDNFNCNQNYWNDGYSDYSKNNQLVNKNLKQPQNAWSKNSRQHTNYPSSKKNEQNNKNDTFSVYSKNIQSENKHSKEKRNTWRKKPKRRSDVGGTKMFQKLHSNAGSVMPAERARAKRREEVKRRQEMKQ